ncbi:MAG: Na-K-Cl cotransporter [Aureliella sp.]
MADKSQSLSGKFGTFGGVFTPCTLTILGVIMFLRFGQVVGQSGLVVAVLIVVAAKTITTLTSLSLSAIATNTRVRGGGAYYLISRSLGVEFGGAIGVVFFLAQAISVAMYVIGFTEALVATVPALTASFVAIASLVNVAVFACVFVGAGWTLKIQYGILAVLVGSLVSFYVGAFHPAASGEFEFSLLQENLWPQFSAGENTFTMFALFFPAVTGIMAGANMSGDLANPSRAIPRGTLAAVFVTGVVYLSLAILLAGLRSADELSTNSLVMRDVALWSWLITAGVFAATLSSALGSMMGAPRILQALARDEIFRSLRIFSKGEGSANEPRRAVVVTFVIAQSCIMVGDLNQIAPVITMFFMITYGLLNLATFYEAVTHNPSYRPTFRLAHWSLSLAGAIGCLLVMLLINWIWALASIGVIAGLHWYIRSREIRQRWGDLQSGLVFERARRALLQLQDEAYHPKNWRPIVMALSGSGWMRPHIPIYGHWLTSGHGILTLAQVITGDIEDHAERRERYESVLRNFIAKQQLQAFPAVTVNEYLSQGIESLIQCHGIGGLRPNTFLFGWPRSAETAEAFGANLRLVARTGRSILAARFTDENEPDDTSNDASRWAVPQGTIDVWWRGMDNGALMVLLAHLLHQNPEWRRNRIRLLRKVENVEGKETVREHLAQLATGARISCTQEVVVSSDSPAQTIQTASKDAALVFMGFKSPEETKELELYHRMEQLAGPLPRVVFVDSAGGMALDT